MWGCRVWQNRLCQAFVEQGSQEAQLQWRWDEAQGYRQFDIFFPTHPEYIALVRNADLPPAKNSNWFIAGRRLSTTDTGAFCTISLGPNSRSTFDNQ